MKQIRKRIGSLLLAFCMVLTMIPTAAFAAAGSVTGNMIIGGKSVSDLTADDTGTGWIWTAETATLELNNSYDSTKPITINCANSNTINLSYTGNVTISSNDASPIFCNGNLNLNETGSGGTLTLNYTGSSYQYSALKVYGNLSISSGTLNVTSAGTAESFYSAIMIYASKGVTITGSANVTATATGADSNGIYTDYYGGITISTNGTVTVNGTGTSYALNAGSNASVIHSSDGTVTLTQNDDSARLYFGILDHTGGTLNGMPATINDVDLANFLSGSSTASFTVADGTILSKDITLGASHTLVIPSNCSLTIEALGRINLGDHTLTINGGGNLILATNRNSLQGNSGTLALENITVNILELGISVKELNIGNQAEVNLGSITQNPQNPIYIGSGCRCTVNSGGKININNFSNQGINISGGTLCIDGGSIHVGTGAGGNSGIYVGNYGSTYATFEFKSGDISGSDGSKIYFYENTVAKGLNGKLSDRNIILNANNITVGDFGASLSEDGNGLTAGNYFYYTSSGRFEKHVITITSQPEDKTVTAGNISGSLSISSEISNRGNIRYQWCKAERKDKLGYSQRIDGATGSTFDIPKNLTAGTYYYYCVLSEAGCSDAYSDAATVTVNTAGGGGGTASGGNSGSTTTTTPEAKPNQPVTVATPVTATTGANGTASANIPANAITDAIAKAQADAKAQGRTDNGISVALNVTMPQGAASLTATIPQSALQSLVTARVSQLEVNGAPVALGLNQSALQSIQSQANGSITIGMAPATGLSASAQTAIGNRPVYNITISFTNKDGKTQNITSLGNGTATLAIPYTPDSREASGSLFGVYVDSKGKVTRISGSVYDASSGSLLIPANHFSVYGVSYEASTAKFTDISKHWAKDSIDYVVSAGLLSGTSKTAFAPDASITREALAMALGKLAGINTKEFTANTFTDVKADSTSRPYIEWAYSKGIIPDIGNHQFAPNQAISREEIAEILQNYANATGYKLPVTRNAVTFADASSIGSGYKDAVTAMQQAGVMMGKKNNKFNPQANTTRAEVSAMLHRYSKLTVNPATAQGWARNDDGQYFYYKQGEALTGWKDIGSGKSKKTYYFTKDGRMVSGKWLKIDDKKYYFYTDGSLAKNTKVDGYKVDKNGVRKTK